MPNATRRPSAPYTLALATSESAPLSALTRRERRDFGQLAHETRRREWLAGRCAAKRAISAFRGVRGPLHHIELEPQAGGAPRCLVRDDVERWTLAPLVLSIAHTHGVAIAAATSCSTRIGVDIERAGDIDAHEYQYFLAPSELAYAQRLGVTLLWVLKEALWKALGLSQALAFKSVQLAFFHDTDTLAGAWVEGKWICARARRVRLATRPELIAAVVTIDEDVR
ncbi:MAG TPA: 4'-phosphopantetheinyl transferase superfamily protein [Gemmatimonadaceae bacterium]|nr:4'-phosphopantetheinyl transferase superfamily protein [Gemmatimonadaceae bacterium]